MIRHRLPSGSATDALGELDSYEDGVLRVRRRDGTVVAIAEESVLAARHVPPPAVRRPRT